jgi:hypothetical protein
MTGIKRMIAVAAVGLLFAALAAAQQERPAASWGGLEFLIGEWTGGGGGQPGQGSGWFSFRTELNGAVLVRKNHADYPATKDRPAFTHDDLMYVYHDPADKSLRAVYFDVEGHVIEYRVTVAADRQTAVFSSDAAPALPRYRLSYAKKGPNEVTLKFEIAPPGKPNEFKTHIEASAERK